ncbi:MAG: hypothetical protein GY807_01395 [Gammaproteobacteria bacterium]|nr:hypothetical protein [Gammaproteobacteria bacterium]
MGLNAACRAFHIAENSDNLLEPLCIYAPFLESKSSPSKIEEGTFTSISKVQLHVPVKPVSDVLKVADTADRLSIDSADEHLMEITFDDHRCGCSRDFRPDMPLVIHW